jgi:alkylhydroperoxidase family enzyme
MTSVSPLNGQLNQCLVPFVPDSGIPQQLQGVLARDRASTGQVRNLTRAVASSIATWQVTTRAEHVYATMQRLDNRTQTLACLYTSLLNGCSYCIDDAAGEALENGPPVHELLALDELPVSVRGEETVARLRYAWWTVVAPERTPPAVLDRLRACADPEEILEFTAVVAMKCFWNRFVSALRIAPEGRCGDEGLLFTLCEISAQLRSNMGAVLGA